MPSLAMTSLRFASSSLLGGILTRRANAEKTHFTSPLRLATCACSSC